MINEDTKNLIKFTETLFIDHFSKFNASYLTYKSVDRKKTNIDATEKFRDWLKENNIADYSKIDSSWGAEEKITKQLTIIYDDEKYSSEINFFKPSTLNKNHKRITINNLSLEGEIYEGGSLKNLLLEPYSLIFTVNRGYLYLIPLNESSDLNKVFNNKDLKYILKNS